jgi:hypothetical protein
MPRRQVPAVHRFLSPHQAAVLDAATHRLVPEPPAHVVAYIDRLLSQFDAQTSARRVRVADLRDQYADGIALLDQLAGGDFTALPRLSQHLVLSHAEVAPFASMLFDHIVEAIYLPPERLRCNAADRRTG